MRTSVVLVALLLALPASAAVYEAHNKQPQRWHQHESAGDDECHENHHLMPDGDNDCDDKGTKGVPEPGTLGLLALGVGGLLLARRRR